MTAARCRTGLACGLGRGLARGLGVLLTALLTAQSMGGSALAQDQAPPPERTRAATGLSCMVLAHRANDLMQRQCLPPAEAVAKAAEALDAACRDAPEGCGAELPVPVRTQDLGLTPFGRFATGLEAPVTGKVSDLPLTGCLFHVGGSLRPAPATCDAEGNRARAEPELEWRALFPDQSPGTGLASLELADPVPEDRAYFLANLRGRYPAGRFYQAPPEENGRIHLKYGLETAIDGDFSAVTLTHPRDLPVATIRLIDNRFAGRVSVRLKRLESAPAPDRPDEVVSRFRTEPLGDITSIDGLAIELRPAPGQNPGQNPDQTPDQTLDLRRIGTLDVFEKVAPDPQRNTPRTWFAGTANAAALLRVLERLGAADLPMGDPALRHLSHAPTGEDAAQEAPVWRIDPRDQLRDTAFPRLAAVVLLRTSVEADSIGDILPGDFAVAYR